MIITGKQYKYLQKVHNFSPQLVGYICRNSPYPFIFYSRLT